MALKYRKCFLILLILMLCSLSGCGGKKDKEDRAIKNDVNIFDSEVVHRIDVTIADEDWDDLLANPVNKTKYEVDLVIDGVTVNDVSFATKGTSSLVIASKKTENTRYSFKINFGYFVEGQTWNGMKTIQLQSLFAKFG